MKRFNKVVIITLLATGCRMQAMLPPTVKSAQDAVAAVQAEVKLKKHTDAVAALNKVRTTSAYKAAIAAELARVTSQTSALTAVSTQLKALADLDANKSIAASKAVFTGQANAKTNTPELKTALLALAQATPANAPKPVILSDVNKTVLLNNAQAVVDASRKALNAIQLLAQLTAIESGIATKKLATIKTGDFGAKVQNMIAAFNGLALDKADATKWQQEEMNKIAGIKAGFDSVNAIPLACFGTGTVLLVDMDSYFKAAFKQDVFNKERDRFKKVLSDAVKANRLPVLQKDDEDKSATKTKPVRLIVVDQNNTKLTEQGMFDAVLQEVFTATCGGFKQCESNLLWNVDKGACACPADKPLLDGGTCKACATGAVWDAVKNACACTDADQQINAEKTACVCAAAKPNLGADGKCYAACEENKEWVSASNACACVKEKPNLGADGKCYAACATGTVWDAATNACKCTVADQTVVNGVCACPADKPLLKDGACTACAAGTQWNAATSTCKSVCPIEGQTMVNGVCTCAGTNEEQVWQAATGTYKCDCKNEHIRAGDGSCQYQTITAAKVCTEKGSVSIPRGGMTNVSINAFIKAPDGSPSPKCQTGDALNGCYAENEAGRWNVAGGYLECDCRAGFKRVDGVCRQQ